MEPEAHVYSNKRGRHHRDDGPAIVYANGDCEWWQHGQLHRADGPAIERADGTCAWFWYGKWVSKAKHAAAARRAGLAVLALDAARRRKRRMAHLPVELWDMLAERLFCRS